MCKYSKQVAIVSLKELYYSSIDCSFDNIGGHI